MSNSTPLSSLYQRRRGHTRRASSWDTSGRNQDYVPIPAGGSSVIAELTGPGVIQHIWITVGNREPDYLRNLILRMAWDGEASPSVETPLGDFFGVGHGAASAFHSLPLSMTRGTGKRGGRTAMNCYFPMPFLQSARIWVENTGPAEVVSFYYYIDWEEWLAAPAQQPLHFHAQWRREVLTGGQDMSGRDLITECFTIPNLDGAGNYTILEAEGAGHFVGCVLSVNNVDRRGGEYQGGPHTWWGEGDDMFFIDGEPWPPRLHGTGTEDYFCNAWGMQRFNGLFYGTSLFGNDDWTGKWSVYRFHILDPVIFHRSLRVTIEHGHANLLSNDYASTAYWYQTEPHAPFPMLPGVDGRRPSDDVVWPAAVGRA